MCSACAARRSSDMPFAIGIRERDAWLGHMRQAVEGTGIAEPYRGALLQYFEGAADFLRNRPEEETA